MWFELLALELSDVLVRAGGASGEGGGAKETCESEADEVEDVDDVDDVESLADVRSSMRAVRFFASLLSSAPRLDDVDPLLVDDVAVVDELESIDWSSDERL